MPVDTSDLYGGYKKSRKRFRDPELESVLSPYKITLASLRQGPKASDSAMRRKAAKAVVDRYRESKGQTPSIRISRHAGQ